MSFTPSTCSSTLVGSVHSSTGQSVRRRHSAEVLEMWRMSDAFTKTPSQRRLDLQNKVSLSEHRGRHARVKRSQTSWRMFPVIPYHRGGSWSSRWLEHSRFDTSVSPAWCRAWSEESKNKNAVEHVQISKVSAVYWEICCGLEMCFLFLHHHKLRLSIKVSLLSV